MGTVFDNVRAWMEGSVAATTHDGVSELTISAADARGFPVVLRAELDTMAVALGPWVQRFGLADEDPTAQADTDAEILDLVAVATFGRARLVVHEAQGHAFRWDVTFGPDSTAPFASIRRFRRPWWGRAQTRVLCNHRFPPRSLVFEPMGTLPFAPWVGARRRAQADGASVRELAVDGELDLHPFHPKEVAPLVREYIEVCRQRGITRLRIVHGKGVGNLRRTVHALLDEDPRVESYRLGGQGEGSWGATLVCLHDPGS